MKDRKGERQSYSKRERARENEKKIREQDRGRGDKGRKR